jgi:regulator of RNase E activity RraA
MFAFTCSGGLVVGDKAGILRRSRRAVDDLIARSEEQLAKDEVSTVMAVVRRKT